MRLNDLACVAPQPRPQRRTPCRPPVEIEDRLIYGAYAAGYAVEASAEMLASAPEAAAGLAAGGIEAAAGVGDAAASVFETVLEIIGGLFSWAGVFTQPA